MATTEFDISTSGVSFTDVEDSSCSLEGRILRVGGRCKEATLIGIDGIAYRFTGSGNFDLSSLNSGMYILRANAGGKTVTKKLT